jgi:RNA polymerase sigma factor (sigma-70 family)
VSARRPFELVVQEHGSVVLRVCRGLVGPDDAEDAWAETFLSALRAWPGLDDDADVRAWLVTIAHHRSVDHLRARGRRAVPHDDLEPFMASGPAGRDPSDDELLDLVRALPPKQRTAVVGRYLADLSYDDVASLADTSNDAARRNAADGIASIRRRYRPEEAAP